MDKDIPKRIIHNPVTGTDYEVKTKSTKYGKKGEIIGMWKHVKKAV